MKSRDLFGYIENGKFLIGWKHRYMTKLARCRFLWRYKKQKGRVTA